MSNQTVINPNVNSTVINSELGQATAINPNLLAAPRRKFVSGVILGGKYQIVESLSVSTGGSRICISANIMIRNMLQKSTGDNALLSRRSSPS